MTEPKFDVIRKITYQQIKLETGIPYYLRLDGEIYLGKGDTRPKVAGDDKAQEPPHLINVTDCETGEVGVIVAPAILVSELNDAYPVGDYVGRGFAIKILGKREGKRYNTIDLAEIKLPEHLTGGTTEVAPDEPTETPSHVRGKKRSS